MKGVISFSVLPLLAVVPFTRSQASHTMGWQGL